MLYGVGFQFAWGTIPWIYPAELFSMSEKGLLADSGFFFALAGIFFRLEGEDSAKNWEIQASHMIPPVASLEAPLQGDLHLKGYHPEG